MADERRMAALVTSTLSISYEEAGDVDGGPRRAGARMAGCGS